MMTPDGQEKMRAELARISDTVRPTIVGPAEPPPAGSRPPIAVADPTRFEQARVTLSSTSGSSVRLAPSPDGWVRMQGVTLGQLIEMASDLPRSRTSTAISHEMQVGAVRDGVHMPPLQIDGPPWIGIERFDVEAYAGSASLDDIRTMLHTLLQERFALVARFELRRVETLALVQADHLAAGPWLVKAQADGTLPPPLAGGCLRFVPPEARPDPLPLPVPGQPDWWRCGGSSGHGVEGAYVTLRAEPLHMLADSLTRIVGRTVLDRTGLEGTYYAHLEFQWPWPRAPLSAAARRRRSSVPPWRRSLGWRCGGWRLPPTCWSSSRPSAIPRTADADPRLVVAVSRP